MKNKIERFYVRSLICTIHLNEEFTWCRIFIEDYRKYFDILDRFHLSYESSDGRSILVYEDYVFSLNIVIPIYLSDR